FTSRETRLVCRQHIYARNMTPIDLSFGIAWLLALPRDPPFPVTRHYKECR
ncbi:hypothetical protein LSAT2_030658, partial [Lamellibrachia satsuma]